METAILEKLIIKIGALLSLGFGEAGSEIIAYNMSSTGYIYKKKLKILLYKKILIISYFFITYFKINKSTYPW